MYKNDVWSMRKEVILKLRDVATRDIVRRRAADRLAALRRRIADAAAAGPEAMKELEGLRIQWVLGRHRESEALELPVVEKPVA